MDATQNGHQDDRPADDGQDPPEVSASGASGKGVQWETDMRECQARNWWGRWNGRRWELVTKDTPGAVEDLQRLAALRRGEPVETDDAWRKALEAKAAKEHHT